MLLELDNADKKRRRVDEKAIRQSLIESFPESTVKRGATVDRCSICLEDMGPGSKIRTLPCLHLFHRRCIDKWLKQPGQLRCPVCQSSLEPQAPGGGDGAAQSAHAEDAVL